MPTYVTLMNWTDQGVRTVRDTVDRSEQADALAQKHGARIEQVYWTVGPYSIRRTKRVARLPPVRR